MNIGYVCNDPGIPVYGQKGCSLHVQEMISAFRGHGADVMLFANRIDGTAPPGLASLPVVMLPAIPPAQHADRETSALATNVPVARLVKQHGPFDIVYERYALWSYAALAAGKAMGATTVLEVNAPLIEEQERYRTLHNRAGALTASLRVFAAADLIVAVSEEVSCYLNQFPQTAGKVHVLPNGVNVERFAGNGRTRTETQRDFTVGFVGTLKPWHGVDILMRAFAAFSTGIDNTRLLIVGDGPETNNLRRLADHLAIVDRVEFTGSVAPQAIPGLLAEMDVGVAPYPELEDFYFSPLKVYEYMASGLPVVASRIGQLSGLIRHESDGLLCRPGHIDELCAALRRIHADPLWATALGQAAQRKVSLQHTWRSVAAQILKLAKCPAPVPVREELAR